MHLNLAVRPCLLSNSRDFEAARHVLRESYADEAIFKWLLGDVSSKRDPAAAQAKRDLLLDWMVDWRISSCQSNSHCLAIPASANNPSASRSSAIPSSSSSSSLPLDLGGCALVSCPGSRSSQVLSLMSLLAYGASPPTPPEALGQACRARFAALEHHCRARDRLGSHTPHWFIHMLAVSPEHRGRGVGRMMMRIVSALADQDAAPVQLQVSGSRSRAYFEQCGFRVMETVDVCCDDSPTLKLFNMTRVPFPKSICLDNVSPPR
uniref:N-acetyltransferase domain-containing protein n=1 Tax=Hemiselmis tepida TaxID=464990 RepID=A0A7S0WBU0_9CRYP|mmetsp:Transcript_36184/g.92426  ORF Transcript_36184/g.92426 Transcript_36184/m.92426 type:complete len:264 (+) Transcript_36184:85-876(+)